MVLALWYLPIITIVAKKIKKITVICNKIIYIRIEIFINIIRQNYKHSGKKKKTRKIEKK